MMPERHSIAFARTLRVSAIIHTFRDDATIADMPPAATLVISPVLLIRHAIIFPALFVIRV